MPEDKESRKSYPFARSAVGTLFQEMENTVDFMDAQITHDAGTPKIDQLATLTPLIFKYR